MHACASGQGSKHRLVLRIKPFALIIKFLCKLVYNFLVFESIHVGEKGSKADSMESFFQTIKGISPDIFEIYYFF